MSIGSFFSKFTSILAILGALLPQLNAFVTAAETALGPGNGSTKLQFVMSLVQAAYNAIGTAETAWADVEPVIKAAVDSIVSAFNATGIFKGKTAAPAA